MTEQEILDQVIALIDENVALKAANADQAEKLILAQKRIRKLEQGER